MISVENILDQTVGQVMTSDVISVNVADPINDVQHLLKSKHIRHAPVLKDEVLVGIISLTDLQRMSFTNTYGDGEAGIDDVISGTFTAEMVMHADPETVNVNTRVSEVARIFVEKEFHALPVTEKGELVGIITTTDILKMLL